MQKLLIDENLSPSLVKLAIAKGFVCSHLNYLGLSGQKDWQLKTTILDGDWTFITNNGVDFRGAARKPGIRGVYADLCLHPGLVCIDAPGGLNLASQQRLFAFVLSNLGEGGALTNQVLQVTLSSNGSVELTRYALPV